ncbi:Peptidyl-prolyl cis-trans isomerase [Tolypocladium capitatum]|uniref:peptidylprolyl isomerase n=1 Tax=Tolypocladium capitatum TaxID=45235 RepID=A0A2K3QJA3_9HYPO|nr:Peptidyl-prolyl cis-trans isomerase [Tolypocladium capitatum]
MADLLQNINNKTLGTSANSFPIVTLPNGEKLPTGTVGALLVNIKAYDAGDAEQRQSLEPALRAAVPVLRKVGMFDLFTPEEWTRGGGPGRSLVGSLALEMGRFVVGNGRLPVIGRLELSSLPLYRSVNYLTPPSSQHDFAFSSTPATRPTSLCQQTNCPHPSVTMGVTKTTLASGSGNQPAVGNTVTIEYTGWLKDTSKPNNKGKQFDSSVGRGDFVVKIGVGQVIKGWDEGVTQMRVGEKATLDITSDFGYGARGFPGAIPPNSDLIFDVELKAAK